MRPTDQGQSGPKILEKVNQLFGQPTPTFLGLHLEPPHKLIFFKPMILYIVIKIDRDTIYGYALSLYESLCGGSLQRTRLPP